MALAVEIGPGKGALTEYLLRLADKVVAVELDVALVAHLRQRWLGETRLEIVEGDALHIDWIRQAPGVLVGNLPYYVATAIVSRYLRMPGELAQGVFLVQKEVAERITAKPGTRDYGYFSVECQFLSAVEYLFTVPPGAFQPPPKVESAVVRLTPRSDRREVDKFLGFVSACFRQKRKTLRNNLAGRYSRDLMEGIPGLGRRAEELSVADFESLHSLLRQEVSPPENEDG